MTDERRSARPRSWRPLTSCSTPAASTRSAWTRCATAAGRLAQADLLALPLEGRPHRRRPAAPSRVVGPRARAGHGHASAEPAGSSSRSSTSSRLVRAEDFRGCIFINSYGESGATSDPVRVGGARPEGRFPASRRATLARSRRDRDARPAARAARRRSPDVCGDRKRPELGRRCARSSRVAHRPRPGPPGCVIGGAPARRRVQGHTIADGRKRMS